ncbi:uncharacterized protein LOC126597741 [Malus sylvestris]|uniref:uncharacterized protein LOC126597741 n=1 Tax=Malus sylvestris TaxID=3752 RepID=UPI0021AD4A8C|nr:uncharacterized protein LOC126597741 [Malus sylvestris]
MLILKIKPQRLLEDPLKSTFKIKPTPLKERSSLDQAQRPFGSIAHPQINTLRRSIQMIKFERDCNPKLSNTNIILCTLFLSLSFSGKFRVHKFGTPSGTIFTSHLFLRSRNLSTLPKLMASRKTQTVPATGVKNKSVFVASGVTLGITTRSKTRATSATSFTSVSTLPREQEHLRHEPMITLASLRAPRGESPRKYSESMLSDADSSGSSAMQVMTTGATSIDEQLAQMNEAIARLTRTVEEKDLQIAALVNRLEAQDGEKPDPEDDPLKGEAGGEEDSRTQKFLQRKEILNKTQGHKIKVK